MSIVDDLVQMAIEKSGPDIEPCINCKSFAESITITSGCVILWYNTKGDHSTHIVKIKSAPE